MGSLGSIADTFNGPMGDFVKTLISGLVALPFGLSVDLNWFPPLG